MCAQWRVTVLFLLCTPVAPSPALLPLRVTPSPGSFGKKMVHAKEQEAAAQHVGRGMGKNDEPIGFCLLSLNEMLEHTRTGAGVKLIHPKGKDKPCGAIFIRLRAVPRLTEDEIASSLQARDA